MLNEYGKNTHEHQYLLFSNQEEKKLVDFRWTSLSHLLVPSQLAMGTPMRDVAGTAWMPA